MVNISWISISYRVTGIKYYMVPDLDQFSVTDCHYYLLSRATLVITSALKKGFTDAGVEKVKPGYLGVLVSLWQKDGLKTVELARMAGLEPSSMTGLLDRMERDGLIYRSSDPHDRRAQHIVLTDFGKEIKKPVLEVLDKTLKSVFQDIEESEINIIKKVLNKVLNNAKRGSN